MALLCGSSLTCQYICGCRARGAGISFADISSPNPSQSQKQATGRALFPFLQVRKLGVREVKPLLWITQPVSGRLGLKPLPPLMTGTPPGQLGLAFAVLAGWSKAQALWWIDDGANS